MSRPHGGWWWWGSPEGDPRAGEALQTPGTLGAQEHSPAVSYRFRVTSLLPTVTLAVYFSNTDGA